MEAWREEGRKLVWDFSATHSKDGPGEGTEPGMLLSCIRTDLYQCSSPSPCSSCSVHAVNVAVGMQQVPLHVAALRPPLQAKLCFINWMFDFGPYLDFIMANQKEMQ